MTDTLTDAKALLVRRWGELGGYWGISRTMAEIHALLFVSGQALCTDDVMAQLHVSRGNASMNLRGLVDWGLVQRIHRLGDRKEYFQADTDVWHMFETITRERRRREVEPIIATIDRCHDIVAHLDERAGDPANAAREFRTRLHELREFLTTMGALFELALRFGKSGIAQLGPLLNVSAANAAVPSPGASAPQRHPRAPAKPSRKRKPPP
jgi:HTH-type transcriptional regulator, glycine betaine synthesis regulator